MVIEEMVKCMPYRAKGHVGANVTFGGHKCPHEQLMVYLDMVGIIFDSWPDTTLYAFDFLNWPNRVVIFVVVE